MGRSRSLRAFIAVAAGLVFLAGVGAAGYRVTRRATAVTVGQALARFRSTDASNSPGEGSTPAGKKKTIVEARRSLAQSENPIRTPAVATQHAPTINAKQRRCK